MPFGKLKSVGGGTGSIDVSGGIRRVALNGVELTFHFEPRWRIMYVHENGMAEFGQRARDVPDDPSFTHRRQGKRPPPCSSRP
jgi:hypothetical protein